MPDTPYTAPVYPLADTDVVSVTKESLDRAILLRQDILARPKPTYNIDGQEFKWSEYLDVLNKTIAQLQKDLQSFSDVYELDSSIYT